METQEKLYQITVSVEEFDTGEHKIVDFLEVTFDCSLAEKWTDEEFRKAIIEQLANDDHKEIFT